MRALTLKGKIADYLRGLPNTTELVTAKEELTKFYKHVTGTCCLDPKLNGKNGCDNCGDTWRHR